MAETLGLITTAGLEQEAHARTGCAAAMVSEPRAKNFSIRSSIGTHPCADMKFANERSSAAACRPRSRGLRPPARGPERGLDALRSARRAGRGAALRCLLTRQPVILPASTGELVKLELGEIDFEWL